MATEPLYRGLIVLFSIIDFVLEKTPSDTIIKSTKSFVLSAKLIKSLSLIFETFLTSFPNLKLFVNNLSLEDGLATLTEFTAKIILSAIKKKDRYKEKIVLCGGGRKNNFLVERLKRDSNRIKLIDEYKIDGDFVESQAFAYLAIRSFLKLPISFPETTGVKLPCTGGTIFKY